MTMVIDRSGKAGSAPDVELRDVVKRFGDVAAVDHVDLSIARGAFYSILGPSGCGKTTTLRMIAGFEQPTSGDILLAGQSIAGVPPYRRNVNTVFQHYALFPHMSVAENVGYGLRQRKVGRLEERKRVSEALDLVRLSGYAARRTWELSGGQQQRVALARALVNHPTVLLLDEPLGALDRQLRHEMQLELKALHQTVGITFVYVTHDQEEALTMSDVIVVMRDGRIQQQGAPEDLYERPANRFVAGFVGSSNFLEAVFLGVEGTDGRASVRTSQGMRLRGVITNRDAQPAAGDRITVLIRPERLRLEAAAGLDGPGATTGAGLQAARTAGRVTQGTFLGDQTEYRVDAEGMGELLIRRQNEIANGDGRAFAPGEAVAVVWHEESCIIVKG